MESRLQRAEISIEQTMARLFEPFLFPPRTLGANLPPIPDSAHVTRHPIIIVHGVADSAIGSQTLAKNLRRDGWTVFTPSMPGNGLDGVEVNSKALGLEIALVQAITGAKLVDLVGHSQGGSDIRWYIGVDHGGANVGRVVTINSPLNGVGGHYLKLKKFLNGLGIYEPLPDGLLELLQGSAMIKRVQQTHLTPSDPKWTSLYSADLDGIVTPVSTPILEGATNIALVQPMRRLLGGTGRGPTHIDANQRCEEAYARLRDALLGPSKSGTQ